MPNSNFPFGVKSYGVPVVPGSPAPGYGIGVGGAGNVTGSNTSTITPGPGSQVFFVNSALATASDAKISNGTDPLRPYKTINFALGSTIANNGDVIYVGPGHVETISAAAGWPNAAASLGADGVTIYFLGSELDRAQITFTTSTAAQLIIGAKNMTLVGARFLTGIDAVAAAISITGSNCKLVGCEFFDAPAKATLIQILTAATATGLQILNYHFYPSTTGTQKTEVIRLIGVNDFVIDGMVAMADFTTAVINNITTLCLRGLIQNCALGNQHAASTLAIAVLTTTTGFVKNTVLQTASGTPWITTSNILSCDLASAGSTPGGTATALV